MPSYTFTTLQQGHESGGAWTDSTTVGPTVTSALLVPKDIGGRRWQGSTLTLLSAGAGGSGTLAVYVVEANRPPLWSSSNLPSRASQSLVGTAVGTLGVGESLVATLGLHDSAGRANRLLAELTRGDTSGTLGLVMTWSGSSVSAAATLAGTYSDETFTGLEGPWRAQGRADLCPRCGMPSTRDTWVRDGYQPGLRVCPKCYDPPDEVGRHVRVGSERPPEGEN